MGQHRDIIKLEWERCYSEAWTGEIVPDAFTHPAKFSRALIRRIYQFLFDEGMLHEKSVVLDPFGGVALGALEAMLKGCDWIGVELEQKFVDLGSQDGWTCREEHLCSDCAAIRAAISANENSIEEKRKVIEDGGYLAEIDDDPFSQGQIIWHSLTDEEHTEWICIIQECLAKLEELYLKKTPCGNHQAGNIELWNRRYGGRFARWGTARIIQGDSRKLLEVLGKADALVSSPPYAQLDLQAGGGVAGRKARERGYYQGYNRDNPENLANLKSGDIDAVIGSPPYQADQVHSRQSKDFEQRSSYYGDGKDNLGNMREGDLDAIVGSPPYSSDVISKRGKDKWAENKDDGGAAWGRRKDGTLITDEYSDSPDNLGNMKEGNVNAVVGSPPFSTPGNNPSGQHRGVRADYKTTKTKSDSPETDYGASPGQLGAMKSGDVGAIISSSPYSEIAAGAGGLNTKPAKEGQQGGRNPKSASQDTDQHYGKSEGQLGTMKHGDVDGVLSSPPYEHGATSLTQDSEMFKEWREINGRSNAKPAMSGLIESYGAAQNNLGNSRGEDFWSAAQMIVAQCYQVLAVGGVAVWVCKDFVRKKKRVPFSSDWVKLCESVGFRQTHWIHALLTENRGTQIDLDGKHHTEIKEHKSFFRRLNEQKGAPKIDWEDVLIFVKDEPATGISIPQETITDTKDEVTQEPPKEEIVEVPVVAKSPEATAIAMPNKARLDGVEKECPECGQMTLFNLAGGWKCPYCGYDIMG